MEINRPTDAQSSGNGSAGQNWQIGNTNLDNAGYGNVGPAQVRSRPPEPRDRYWLHVVLFILTLISTVMVGGQWVGRTLLYQMPESPSIWQPFLLLLDPTFLLDGLRFGFSLLLFLTVHEFGHYFAARYHRISTSLPYYIPTFIVGIGTLGAVIRIREAIPSTRKLFDVGIAGPLAGFVAALGVLMFAFFTLPDPSYIMALEGHEALKQYVEQFGTFPQSALDLGNPEEGVATIKVGQTALFWILSQFFEHVPPLDEMYHYPMLFAGWLGLFFTALNLLPVGQLDGGHVLYALVGPTWHKRLARSFVVLLLLSGSIGFVIDVFPSLAERSATLGQFSWFILSGIVYFFLSKVFDGEHRLIAPILLGIISITVLSQLNPDFFGEFGYSGWFVWCLLIVYLIKIEHPPVLQPQELTRGRKALAIACIFIFVLCFSFAPLRVIVS